jgi:hypothetical protein
MEEGEQGCQLARHLAKTSAASVSAGHLGLDQERPIGPPAPVLPTAAADVQRWAVLGSAGVWRLESCTPAVVIHVLVEMGKLTQDSLCLHQVAWGLRESS